jgi:hypothetical protein
VAGNSFDTRGSLAATFSQARADETGEWMAKRGQYTDTKSLRVDAVQIIRDIAARKQAIQQCRRQYAGAKLIELTYEELTDGSNGVNESAIGRIGEFLGVTDEFSRTPETTKLVTQPMSQAIDNYEEVLAIAAARNVPLALADKPERVES